MFRSIDNKFMDEANKRMVRYLKNIDVHGSVKINLCLFNDLQKGYNPTKHNDESEYITSITDIINIIKNVMTKPFTIKHNIRIPTNTKSAKINNVNPFYYFVEVSIVYYPK